MHEWIGLFNLCTYVTDTGNIGRCRVVTIGDAVLLTDPVLQPMEAGSVA